MLRKMARRVVPFALRRILNQARTTLKRQALEARWRVLGPASRRAFLENRLGVGQNTWLFIAGMNNSGTTLLAQILRNTNRFQSLPTEGTMLSSALPYPRKLGVHRLSTLLMSRFRWTEETAGPDAEQVMCDWAMHYTGSGILLEKSSTNVLRTRWLQRHFQPAVFVPLVRDAYAVCEGIRRRRHYPLEYAAVHWALCNQALLEDLPHLKHVALVRYENLCAQPEFELDRIRCLLGLPEPFDPASYEGKFAVHNYNRSSSTVRNFNQGSYQRLSREDFAIITRIAGPVLEQLGYPIRSSAEDATGEAFPRRAAA